MARAFVIRPFGPKKDSSGRELDFDRVHRELIEPALEAVGITGGTTGEIVDSGNIREDMFQLILEADLVVCDITIHNANVFYELGIRHALRKRRTVLIKGSPTTEATPFDLLTDRYTPYDIADPAQSRALLEDVLRATLASGRATDSPIFQMVPRLAEADPDRVQIVPADLEEEVSRAVAIRAKGWLRLLADEVREQRFERSGLKLIGRAQWDVKDYEGACETWERVRALYPSDLDANLALANVYERRSRDEPSPEQRVQLLVRSDQAIDRALADRSSTPRNVVAEALALRGRNQKTHWRAALQAARSVEERRQKAVTRTLIESFESYRTAFRHDLNHYYPGLAALQMGTILLELSSEEVWPDAFPNDTEAQQYRVQLQAAVPLLKEVVRMSIQAALDKDANDRWARISEADLLFLSSEGTGRVVRAYEGAFTGARPFDWDAARGQLALYADLGLHAERVGCVIEAVDRVVQAPSPDGPPVHLVVFAGHQVDKPGRAESRFPEDRENQARDLIEAAMKELIRSDERLVGLGSASPGADILWHEACARLGLETILCLPMPARDHSREVFQEHDRWRSRFLRLLENPKREPLILSDLPGLPRWLEGRGLDPWKRGNEWVIKLALSWGAAKITLLTFWDGREEDATRAGTAQMVQLARSAGIVHIQTIDSRRILS